MQEQILQAKIVVDVVLVEVNKKENTCGIEVRIPPFETLALVLKGIYNISQIKTAIIAAFDEVRKKGYRTKGFIETVQKVLENSKR